VAPSTSYREWAPPAALADAVDCLWTHRVGDLEPNPVLPDGCSDLIWRAGHGAFVAGPDTGPASLLLGEGTVLVGLRLRPGAGRAGLGVPLHHLRDQRVDLADLHPADARELHGALTPEAAADLLTRVTARRLDADDPDAAVAEAGAVLADPQADLGRVCGQVGLSERQLRRRFHAAVGYGPKTLQRVLRFRAFLDRAPAEGLADAAARAGFADQPHLNRECRDLSGMTPSQLVARWA
jgi:AraC-like DNA-binding protein